MIHESELAWVAGVVDTLGNYNFRETPSGVVLPSVYVQTTKAELVKPLADLTGIKLVTVKKDYMRSGCGDHCDEPHQHVKSTSSRFGLVGARATVFVSAIFPYLRTRHDEATEVIRLGLEAKHKPATLQKMYELGWPVVRFPEPLPNNIHQIRASS